MTQTLPLITYLTHNYDQAIAWFSRCLQFQLLEDTDEGHKRWVRMAPHPNAVTAFLIAQASTRAKASRTPKDVLTANWAYAAKCWLHLP